MARGGKRKGAGRPKGVRSSRTREVIEKAESEGITPLDYMLKVMRDEGADEKRRDGMAIAAAPYLHPKLSAVEHTGKDRGPIETKDVSDVEFARRLAYLMAKGAAAADDGNA